MTPSPSAIALTEEERTPPEPGPCGNVWVQFDEDASLEAIAGNYDVVAVGNVVEIGPARFNPGRREIFMLPVSRQMVLDLELVLFGVPGDTRVKVRVPGGSPGPGCHYSVSIVSDTLTVGARRLFFLDYLAPTGSDLPPQLTVVRDWPISRRDVVLTAVDGRLPLREVALRLAEAAQVDVLPRRPGIVPP